MALEQLCQKDGKGNKINFERKVKVTPTLMGLLKPSDLLPLVNQPGQVGVTCYNKN